MKAKEVVDRIAIRRPTLLMGGMAVILHGLSRTTKDIDIWPDPRPDAQDWAATMHALLAEAPELQFAEIAPHGRWQPIAADDLPTVASRDGLIRILTEDRPVDAFYLPNELGTEDFASAWARATPLDGALRLMEEVDLIISKQDTGRPHDDIDIGFLTEKIERTYKEKLLDCEPEAARRMVERFATPEIAAHLARHRSDTRLREYALNLLREMSEQGDPFAAELLKELQGTPL